MNHEETKSTPKEPQRQFETQVGLFRSDRCLDPYTARAYTTLVVLLLTQCIDFRKNEFSQLLHDIDEGKARKKAAVYDYNLINFLKRGNSSPSSKSAFIVKILTENLDRSAEYLLFQLKKEEQKTIQLEIPGKTGHMSLLFTLSNEHMILNIMNVLAPCQWKMMSRNDLEENLFHHFIKQKMIRAISQLLSFTGQGVEELLFQQDVAGNFPVMTVLTQNIEQSAQQIWKHMIQAKENINETKIDSEVQGAQRIQKQKIQTEENIDTNQIDNDFRAEYVNDFVTAINQLPRLSEIGEEEIVKQFRKISRERKENSLNSQGGLRQFHLSYDVQPPGRGETQSLALDKPTNPSKLGHSELYKGALDKKLGDREQDGDTKKCANSSRTHIETILRHRNKKLSTLLHICAEFKQNALLNDIFNTEEVSKLVIQEVLMENNPDGKSVLSLIKDQDTMLNILCKLSIKDMNIFDSLDKKGRNIFHHLVMKDFVRVVRHLKNFISKEEFLKMILHPGSRHKNNVLMRAALACATECLQFLLTFISNEEFPLEQIDRVLHDLNSSGNNLLFLVLQQGEALRVSKHNLLELEKKYHDKETDKAQNALIRCLKRNIKPSAEVLEAIYDAKGSLPKNCFDTTFIIGKSFIQHFLIPSTIIAVDIAFDILLINKYSAMDQECLDYNFEKCVSLSEGENITGLERMLECEFPYSQPVPRYACIPLKLAKTPR